MKIKSFYAILASLAISSLFFISSCKEKDETPDNNNTAQTGLVDVQFTHKWGASLVPFFMNQDMLQPKTKDTLNFTTLKYYVSNIKLKNSNSTWWVDPESYYLLDATVDGGLKIALDKVPTGNYTEMEYTMGVDSIRNVSGAQTGALSVSNAMFWSWNSGYIMIKAEGTSPNSSTGDFAYHLGGFSGVYNIVKVKTAVFGGAGLSVATNGKPVVNMVANPAKFWHTITGVGSVSKINTPGADAKQAAFDFYDGIFFEKIQP